MYTKVVSLENRVDSSFSDNLLFKRQEPPKNARAIFEGDKDLLRLIGSTPGPKGDAFRSWYYRFAQ